MEQNMRFGLVWGQVAVVKILDWAVKYATLEGKYFMFSRTKKYTLKKNVESALNKTQKH